MAFLCIALGLAARWWAVSDAGYSRADLSRFETVSGVDLPDSYGEMPYLLAWSRRDGQVFMALAADPLLQGPARRLGVPDYRYGRVGYSWLAFLLAGGRDALLPVTLLAINVVALGTVGWLAGRVLPRAPTAAVAWLLNPAVYLGTAGDTSETLGVALLLLALMSRGGLGWAVALGTVRAELLTALPLKRRRGLPLVLTTLIVAALLRIVAVAVFGISTGAAGNLTWPLVGYARHVNEVGLVMGLPALFLGGLAVATAVIGLRRPSIEQKLAFLATAALLLMFDARVLLHPPDFARAAAALPVVWTAAFVPSPFEQADRTD